jgi:CBS domain containing-hemolysin-like protein
VDKLPVVEGGQSKKIIGMVRRRDVIGAYYDKISSLRNIDQS